jgi:pimeloyl-ACP methyl ester carboxylesterase
MDFIHRDTEVNGHKIHYVTCGQGRPVLLLHGWPQTWYAWRYIMPELAKEYTVIAPDLTGLGDSSAPAVFDQQTVADDMYQLMQQLGYTDVLIVAHDWGASIGYQYAVSHEAEVSKLVILDVGIMNSNMESRPLLPRSGKNLWWFPFHTVEELPEILIEGRERIYLNWFFNNSTVNKNAISAADLDEYTRCYAAPGAMGRSLTYYRNVFKTIDNNKINALTKLTIPVMALGGEQSFGMYPLESLKTVAENVTGGVIADCGHYIAEEQPAVLLEKLKVFFELNGVA